MKITSSGISTINHVETPVLALGELMFDNRNLRQLPLDPDVISYNKPRQVKNAVFSLVKPTPILEPILVAASKSALALIGVDITKCTAQFLSSYFSGNEIIPGSQPSAHCYCGHQFGNFAGQLGDGATMYLGEIINPKTDLRWEIQLKGAGPTPYSRSADGRKVLRSTVREFLCSEAMNYLNIPTTRAATCITSELTTVPRDPLYNGNELKEQCSVVCRIAPNFFRFGSFEIFKGNAKDGNDRAGPSAGNEPLKKLLLDHILLYYPDINQDQVSDTDKYGRLFEEITQRTAELVARWQSVGFVHGVLNTDNMSIMGLTIDYGPYGFMEYFDSDFVPNGSDSSGRYSFRKQPEICKWNLLKLSEMIVGSKLLSPSDQQQSLQNYQKHYQTKFYEIMQQKFGFLNSFSSLYSKTPLTASGPSNLCPPVDETDSFLQDFYKVMDETRVDYTNAFVALTEFNQDLLEHHLSQDHFTTTATIITATTAIITAFKAKLVDKLVAQCASPKTMVALLRRKGKIHRLGMNPDHLMQLWTLLETDPEKLSDMFGGVAVEDLRNELSGEKSKLDLLNKLSKEMNQFQTLPEEMKESIDRLKWTTWCDEYIRRLKLDEKITQLSKESEAEDPNKGIRFLQRRVEMMRKVNPTFVLRNWIAQDAISMAERKVENRLKVRKDGQSMVSGGVQEGEEVDYDYIRVILAMVSDPFNPCWSVLKESDEAGKTRRTNHLMEWITRLRSSEEDGEEDVTDSLSDVSIDKVLKIVERYTSESPDWSEGLICTCSS